MAKKIDTKKAARKIDDALAVLYALGLPRQQQNERSALTLLSLLGLKPNDTWDKATDPAALTHLNGPRRADFRTPGGGRPTIP